MSNKAENTSRYSSQQGWWQFLIRHTLLLKVVTWLSSLSLLASANVSWAEVQPLEINSPSVVPTLFRSKPLPIISPAQSVAAVARVTPVVAPLPVVNRHPGLARLSINNQLTRTSKAQLTAPKLLAQKAVVQLAKPQVLAPLSIPGAVPINVAPPQTNVIPTRAVEPLSAIPTVSKLSVPSLSPLPVVQPAANTGTTAPVLSISNYATADGLIYPLASPAPMTSNFGWRTHPITGNRRFHAGVDLGAPSGAPVVAAATGRVVIAGWHGGYGKAVAIEHNGKLQTLYGHLSEIFVQEGQEIRQGTVIGRVGSTGNSTGPHLHFETHAATSDGWVAVDPGPEVRYALDNLQQALQYSRRDLTPGN
jgi:murein DD-endopeptidase MepM/ murein hydrolase activator NlpD